MLSNVLSTSVRAILSRGVGIHTLPCLLSSNSSHGKTLHSSTSLEPSTKHRSQATGFTSKNPKFETDEVIQSLLEYPDGNGIYEDEGASGDVLIDDDDCDKLIEESIGIKLDSSEIPSSSFVIGIDPDVSGALAVIKSINGDVTADIIDVPTLTAIVGKRKRRKHDAASISKILRGLNAPNGSVAFVEHGVPSPMNGKQSWFGTGYGYGIWIGALFALNFTVVPVTARKWKLDMGLSGKQYTKDESRALAMSFFPALSSQLKRKKDHGRAEALLIAAWGKGYRPEKEQEQDMDNGSEEE